tara:strand:- start:1618 stop:1824 length:207 start_codon:yes stop_codon:yes gene_type:complete
MNKEFDIAKTIYNLQNAKEQLNISNYKFEINKELKIVKEILFIKEDEKVLFGDITGKELYKYFSVSPF